MVAANLKAETLKLMERRRGIEEEMDAIIQRLCQTGGPGLSGNLVDAEGFPRADIDIPIVRAQRHRLAELRNDHIDITEKLTQNIQLFAFRQACTNNSSFHDSGVKARDINLGMSSLINNAVVGSSSGAMDVDLVVSRPFAVVDEITESSPAAEDGLQLGDQIVKFGNVEMGENLLSRLATEAQTKQGQAVSLVLMRQGAMINMTVTPRTWSGRGLLGYNSFSCCLLVFCLCLFKYINDFYSPPPITSEC